MREEEEKKDPDGGMALLTTTTAPRDGNPAKDKGSHINHGKNNNSQAVKQETPMPAKDDGDNNSVGSGTSDMTGLETDVLAIATNLVKEKLQSAREKDKEKFHRAVQRFKDKRRVLKKALKDNQEENGRLIAEREEAKQALELERQNSHKMLASQRRALERNERMQVSADRLRQRIDMLEEQKYSWEGERLTLMRKIEDLQQQQQQGKEKHDEQSDEDEPMEVSTSDSPTALRKQQKKNREAILSFQLQDITKKFEFQHKLLNMKNEELKLLQAANEALESDLETMKNDMNANENLVADLTQEVNKERELRESLVQVNGHLQSERKVLLEQLEVCRQKIASQQDFVVTLKDEISIRQQAQQKQAEELISRCNQMFEEQPYERTKDEPPIPEKHHAQEELQSNSVKKEKPQEGPLSTQLESKPDQLEQGSLEPLQPPATELKESYVSELEAVRQELIEAKKALTEKNQLEQALKESQQQVKSLQIELERVNIENKVALLQGKEEVSTNTLDSFTGLVDLMDRHSSLVENISKELQKKEC